MEQVLLIIRAIRFLLVCSFLFTLCTTSNTDVPDAKMTICAAVFSLSIFIFHEDSIAIWEKLINICGIFGSLLLTIHYALFYHLSKQHSENSGSTDA